MMIPGIIKISDNIRKLYTIVQASNEIAIPPIRLKVTSTDRNTKRVNLALPASLLVINS